MFYLMNLNWVVMRVSRSPWQRDRGQLVTRDTWHKMRHGCVTEMAGLAGVPGTGPCKHEQWGRCSLAPSPGRHHHMDNTILQMLFCHSRQTIQNTRHMQESINTRIRPKQTFLLLFFWIRVEKGVFFPCQWRSTCTCTWWMRNLSQERPI